MELLNGMETRRSYRSFKSTPVPEQTLKKVLEAASRSSSYTNTQPWEVAVVSGKKKEELSRIIHGLASSNTTPNPDMPLPKFPPALDMRAKEHGARRLTAMGVERDDKERRNEVRLQNFKFYGAPCALFLFMDSSLAHWSIFDMGLFAENLILAAHACGLGTCLQASITNYPDAVREFLGIPKTKMLVIGISLGYPDMKAPVNAYQSSRISVDEFVKWYA